MASWACTRGFMLPFFAFASMLAMAPAQVRWSAPVGCPDEAQARGWVQEALAGRKASVDASVTVRAGPRGWVAELRTGGAVRTLEDPDCVALGRAVAVVLAIDAVAAQGSEAESELEPPAVVAEPEPVPLERGAREESVTQPPTLAATAETAAQPSLTSEPTPALEHRLGLVGGGAWGPVAAVAGAAGVRYRVGRKRWEVGVDGLYQAPRTVRYPDGVAGGAFQSVSGSLSGCAVLGPGRVRFPVCLGVEAGALVGRGVDAFETRGATEPWLSTRLDGGVRGQVTQRFELGFEAQGGVALVRPAFNIGDRPPLTQTPRLQARGLISVFWRLR